MQGKALVGRTSIAVALVFLGSLPPGSARAQAPLDLGEYCFYGLTYSNGQTFFHNRDGPRPHGLYKTDGTVAGTVHISDAGSPSARGADVNGIFVFDSGAQELWRSDGSKAGTYRLPSPPLVDYVWGQDNGHIYFWADPPGPGMELWKSDGTLPGTTLVKAFAVGLTPHQLPTFQSVNGFMLFLADDGVHGWELWRTEGTPASTSLVADLTPGPFHTGGGFRLDSLRSRDGDAARAGTGVLGLVTGVPLEFGIWRTDGTAGGTRLLVPRGGSVMQEVDGLAFLQVYDADGRPGGLWRSDGTPDGTFLLKDVQLSPWASSRLNDLLLLPADDGTTGREPWRSDGSPAGTELIRDVHPGPNSGVPGEWPGAHGNGWQFFPGTAGPPFLGLWRTDGSSGGTVPVAEAAGIEVLWPFSASGERLFFRGSPCRLLAHPLPSAEATRGDLLFRHRRTGEVSLWLMNGLSREREVRLDYTTFPGPSWEIAGTADFNGDARMDLLWRHTTTGRLEAWFLDGTRRLRAAPLNPSAMPDTAWRIAATGDFNGDGKADIVWRHADSGQIALWYMDGVTLTGGTLTTPPAVAGSAWEIVGTGRFDADSQTDLLWWHSGSGQLVVWHMNGSTLVTGEFTSPAALPDTAWRPVATRDYNADGKTDIVWNHSGSGQVVVWHMDGSALASGTFTAPESRPAADWEVVGPR
jgi:ELWxxDGT repeat protein